MFIFNEELFLKADNKLKDFTNIFEQKESIINVLNNLPFKYEFSSEVDSICSNLKEVNTTVKELREKILKVKIIFNLIDESSFDDFDNIDLSTFANDMFLDDANPLSFLNYGQYGADQNEVINLIGKAQNDYYSLTEPEKKQYQDLLMIFNKYGYITKEGNWNKSMYKFMEAARNGGCGYAANTNIIVSMYSVMENGNEEFMKKYGFSLYYENSNGEREYNYSLLFASHYLNSINNYSNQIIPGMNIQIPSWFPKWNPSFLATLTNGGSSCMQVNNALSNEFDDGTFEITTKKILYNDWKQSIDFSKQDYITINAHDFTLKDLDGNTYHVLPGHFMLITGTTSDGEIIITSWGQKFILEDVGFGEISYIDVRR